MAARLPEPFLDKKAKAKAKAKASKTTRKGKHTTAFHGSNHLPKGKK